MILRIPLWWPISSTRAKIALVAVAMTLLTCQSADADLKLHKIRAPEHCPDGLTITAKANEGMIDFDVSVNAEEVAHAGELYKGRVKARAYLQIAAADQQLAYIRLHETIDAQRTRFQFRISPSAAKSSELHLGVNLFEKNGFATVGGGASMQIYLAAFVQMVDKAEEAKEGQ